MRISELITKMSTSADKRAVAHLESIFAESVFGLLMDGLPKCEPGQTLVIDGSGSVMMPLVEDPNGRKMIKACADPDIFHVNYPDCINVTMTGKELVEMAEKVPEAEGILICSAMSFHSLPIYRAAYQRVTCVKGAATSRKWWQVWKTAHPAPPIDASRG